MFRLLLGDCIAKTKTSEPHGGQALKMYHIKKYYLLFSLTPLCVLTGLGPSLHSGRISVF